MGEPTLRCSAALVDRVVALATEHGPVSQGWLRRQLRGPGERMAQRGMVSSALLEALAAGRILRHATIDDRGVPRIVYEAAPASAQSRGPVRGRSAAKRAVRIQQLLAEHGPMAVAELATALGCSGSTVRRALTVAETLGIERVAGEVPHRWRLTQVQSPSSRTCLGREALTEPDFDLLGVS